MYLCLYVYIRNALACYLNLYPNYMTPNFTCLHCKGRMRIMTSNCYSYAIFILFPPDFIFLVKPHYDLLKFHINSIKYIKHHSDGNN